MESSDACKELSARWSLKVIIGTSWLKETAENSWEGKRLNIAMIRDGEEMRICFES